MQKQEPKRVLAVVSDLFFSVKISEAAKRNGLALEFVKEGKELMEKAKVKPSRRITMSPGSRPRPSFESQGHRRPASTKTIPMTISQRAIAR